MSLGDVPQTFLHDVLLGGDPRAPAVTAEETLDYAALGALVEKVASGLAELGVRRGDRVAIYLNKVLALPGTILGASRAGGVVVPVNPVLKEAQVAHILADCSARVLVTSPDRWAALDPDRLPSSLTSVVLVGDSPPFSSSDGPRLVSWRDFLGARTVPSGPRTDDDLAAIFYTSGSTGLPKGVVLSHRNLLVGAVSVSGYLGNAADDCILGLLPLSFDAGFSQLTTGLVVGAHVVLADFRFPRDVPRLCAQHGVTGLTCVPPLWIQIADQDWPEEATGTLRYFANTGGRLPRTTLDRLRRVFPGARPFLMYGLTEAFRSTYLDPDQVDLRPDSIGKAIPNAEILVVRPDGTLCEPHEPGELVHVGPLVAQGYWDDVARTAERFREAPGRPAEVPLRRPAVWSGDTVVRDEDGFLYFVGRTDEMIKSSGYRISPTEVEQAAYATGLVRDAVAFGVPDDKAGQRVVLVVAALAGSAPASEDVRQAMRVLLPLFMVPAEVVVRPELPRSANGKYDRPAIREDYES